MDRRERLDRAEQIAVVLRIPLLEVRRELGLWVPADLESEQRPAADPLAGMSNAELAAYLAQRLAAEPDTDDTAGQTDGTSQDGRGRTAG